MSDNIRQVMVDRVLSDLRAGELESLRWHLRAEAQRTGHPAPVTHDPTLAEYEAAVAIFTGKPAPHKPGPPDLRVVRDDE